jgi:hypothetical protein
MKRFVHLRVALLALAAVGCKTGKSEKEPAAYGKPGFTVIPAADNRVWVFRDGSKELDEFRAKGELAKHVTRPGAGPGGMTVKAPDSETIVEYASSRDGFETFVRDGRIWVFRPGSKELAEFEKSGEPAKSVTRPNAGPMGMTVKGPDADTITEYLGAKSGFVTRAKDGRLWVFRDGAKELEEFQKGGELAKHVTRPGAGPKGITIKAPDTETAVDYAVACDGFATFVRDGRIWVFRPGSKELAEFEKSGEPAKSVTRPLAGPMRMTVKGPDVDTIDAYVGAVGSRPAPAPAGASTAMAKETALPKERDGRAVEPARAAPDPAHVKAGFVVMPGDEDRLWVFREDSRELDEFRRKGELAKHVTRPGAGPGGITLKAPDSETILDYVAARDGFETFVRDGRIWVFLPGSKELAEFEKSGEPAKSVTRVGAGPLGMTVKGPDTSTIDAYLEAIAGA